MGHAQIAGHGDAKRGGGDRSDYFSRHVYFPAPVGTHNHMRRSGIAVRRSGQSSETVAPAARNAVAGTMGRVPQRRRALRPPVIQCAQHDHRRVRNFFLKTKRAVERVAINFRLNVINRRTSEYHPCFPSHVISRGNNEYSGEKPLSGALNGSCRALAFDMNYNQALE